MWQSAIQTIISALLGLFASPIAGAIGPGNWYLLGAGLAAAVFVVSVVYVPETKYVRSLEAYGQDVENGDDSSDDQELQRPPVRLSERPALDYTKFAPRTIWSDMRLFVGRADWSEGFYALRVGQPCNRAASAPVY